jgi:hypothetical protein
MDGFTLFCISLGIMIIVGLLHSIIIHVKKIPMRSKTYKIPLFILFGQLWFVTMAFLLGISLWLSLLITVIGLLLFIPIFNSIILSLEITEKTVNAIETKNPRFKFVRYTVAIIAVIYLLFKIYWDFFA